MKSLYLYFSGDILIFLPSFLGGYKGYKGVISPFSVSKARFYYKSTILWSGFGAIYSFFFNLSFSYVSFDFYGSRSIDSLYFSCKVKSNVFYLWL